MTAVVRSPDDREMSAEMVSVSSGNDGEVEVEEISGRHDSAAEISPMRM